MRHFTYILLAAAMLSACGGGAESGRDGAVVPGDAIAGGDTAPGAPAAEAPGEAPVSGAEVDDGSPASGSPPAGGVSGPGGGTQAAVPPARPATGGTQPAAPPAQPGTAAAPGAQPAAAAPAADDGAAVLRRAAAAYENVRSLRADFVMTFEIPLLRRTGTSRGTIYQRQPDRLAVRFSEPEGDVIVSDGQFFWLYYPSNNAQQVTRAPAAAAGQSAVNLQAQFVGNPVERFSYSHGGTESVGGRQAHVLTLTPRQRAEYQTLKVWLDARDSMARRFEITEHNGTIRRFDLQNLQVNPSIPDNIFRFTPPDGVRIVTPG